MFKELEKRLRQTGDQSDKIIANTIAQLQSMRGKDFPIYETRFRGVNNFSEEAKEKLTRQGYVIYRLTGQSLKDFKKSGRPFWGDWHRDYPDFESIRSLVGDVAIHPDNFLLPGSNKKSVAEQMEMVNKYSDIVKEQVGDAEAIIGEMPDYIGIVFNHLDATGKMLLSSDYTRGSARTLTQIRSGFAFVGNFNQKLGLLVNYSSIEEQQHVWAAPLIVPSLNS